jgi:Domain of unknown function (DUF6894)
MRLTRKKAERLAEHSDPLQQRSASQFSLTGTQHTACVMRTNWQQFEVGALPRFFFHVYTDAVAFDDEGLELQSPVIAKEAAIRTARELAAEEIRDKGQVSIRHRIEVEDGDGRPLFTLPLSAAFKIVH